MRYFLCTLLLLSACSTAQIQKTEKVIAKFEAETKMVIVTGCKIEPEIKVGVELFASLYPAADSVVVIADTMADRFCEKVLALSQSQK